MRLITTQNSKFNYYEDTLVFINLVKFVDKQTIFLKVVLKIFVINIIRKDILLLFVLTKYLKKKVIKSAIKMIISIDNILKTIIENTIN